MKIFKQKYPRSILELSSSGVKLTIVPSSPAIPINPSQWRVYKTKTKTGREGIKGSRMDLEFWRSRVLPVIQKYLEIAGGLEQTYCIATAWAREISNLPQVQALTPIDINVLSATEEAEASRRAFIGATKLNLKKYQEILLIDSGSLSTEVISILSGKSVSLREHESSSSQKRKLNSAFGNVKDLENVLLISTENLWDPKTGEANKWHLHDSIYTPENIRKRSDLFWIVQELGSWPVVINGATLGIGVALMG